MHKLVKFTADDDGKKIDKEDQVWCLATSWCGSPAKLCSAEVFGFGEGDAVFEVKSVKRGGITCPECLNFIKAIKGIKL